MTNNFAPTGYPLFPRSYARFTENGRETWEQAIDRCLDDLAEIGKLTPEETELVKQQALELKALPSGRWLWVGGTPWIKNPENHPGAFNCTSTEVVDWRSIADMMELAMMGAGTGAVLEDKNIEQLPVIRNELRVKVVKDIGTNAKKVDYTTDLHSENFIKITVGDSRQGWVQSLLSLLDAATDILCDGYVDVEIDLGNVRPKGEKLKGFGGIANPSMLPGLYGKIAKILNKAMGRKLTSTEICLIIDEAALVVVAGNIRRCLPAYAKVHTPKGKKMISDIRVGDIVLTPIGERRVAEVFFQGKQWLFNIITTLEDDFFQATKKHRMAVSVDGEVEWKELCDLKKGDRLVRHDGRESFVERLEKRKMFDTYDIEVEEAHCFYADGYLTHNSAGMRQFSENDVIAAAAKDNLWIQDEAGNWLIDPDRDALRMANHTRVFHHKPTLDELKAAVAKQYYSGEGAIQYAPEAIARASADLLRDDDDRIAFIDLYVKDREKAKQFLAEKGAKKDLEHRMLRYGLNPCFAPGTQIMTTEGDRAIETLVGKTVTVYDGEQWVTIDNFRVTGENQKVLIISVVNGRYATPTTIKVTENHKFILESGKKVTAKELKVGDCLLTIYQNQGESQIVSSIREQEHLEPKVYCCTVPTNHRVTLASGIVTGQCGEIVGSNFFCNLSEVHLNRVGVGGLKQAFQAAALNAAALLHLEIINDRYNKSREWDPIVGVSFTGLFDFFVNSFGVDWLKWWKSGRSMSFPYANYYKEAEENYLSWWRSIVEETIEEYCDLHGLKKPNRCTTVQPSGSKSLLTGASPGWHPPKAQRYIRRMTFAKNDPIVLACLDYGYSVVPSQSDKDDDGRLLNDPFDPRCTEWLVEIPVEVPWANLPGADKIDISQFSVLAQFDFYMQVQKHYTTHNTSATFELREHEINEFAEAIYGAIDNNEGYISGAILARFDDKETYPRLPFEPVSREVYDGLITEVKQRRKGEDFMELLKKYDRGIREESGPSGCDSDKCLLPGVK